MGSIRATAAESAPRHRKAPSNHFSSAQLAIQPDLHCAAAQTGDRGTTGPDAAGLEGRGTEWKHD